MKKRTMIRMLWDQIRAVVLTLLMSDAAILFLNYLYVNKLDLWLFYSVLILIGIALYTGFKVFEIKKIQSDLQVDDFNESHYSDSAYPFVMKLQELETRIRQLDNEYEAEKRELSDYFSMWTHQAKLPIFAMKLMLESNETEPGELKSQLSRLESYVNSAMAYIRLSSASTDFVLSRQNIDQIVREEIRANAGSFIRKKIAVDFQGENLMAVTDNKWLAFVISQILSNALKYSSSNSVIKIQSLADRGELIIEDHGCGISKQDLPRIFEKGFTGISGHTSKESSGIGLYLCGRILNQLNHTIKIESEPQKGTRVILGFPEELKIQD